MSIQFVQIRVFYRGFFLLSTVFVDTYIIFIRLKIYLLLLALNFFKHAKDNFISNLCNLLFMFWIVFGGFSPNTMDLP